MLIDKTEEHQVAHAQMLSDAQDILLSFGVVPILSGSALLGAVRDGDLLPWQTGVVLIVKYEEIKPYIFDIVNTINEKGYKITKFFKHKKEFKITMMRDGLLIEITGFHLNTDNNKYERKCRSKYKSVPDYFFNPPYKQIDIRGIFYNCPFETEKYLELLYTKNWRTPIKSDKGSDFRNRELYRFPN